MSVTNSQRRTPQTQMQHSRNTVDHCVYQIHSARGKPLETAHIDTVQLHQSTQIPSDALSDVQDLKLKVPNPICYVLIC